MYVVQIRTRMKSLEKDSAEFKVLDAGKGQ